MPDLYKSKLWSDGEGLTHGDLNDASAWALARLCDQLLEHNAGILGANKDPDLWAENGADTDLVSLLYTATGGDAMLKQGTTATRVSTAGGTVFQKIANADGAAPSFVPYTFAPGEFDLVIGAGHATLPRIDIIQVRLQITDGDAETRDFKDAVTGALTTASTSKTRRVTATVSLKAGTAAATPSYPAPDSGYAVLGAVRVPATWTTGIAADGAGVSSAGLRQCSVPLRIEAVSGWGYIYPASSASLWERDGMIWSAVGGAEVQLIARCPAAGFGRRIVGVAVTARWVSSGEVLLHHFPWTSLGPTMAGPSTIPSHDLSSVLVNADGTLRTYFAHAGHIADASPDSNPSATNGPIGDGFWCSGARGGPIWRTDAPPSTTNLGRLAGLQIAGGDGTQIMDVIWYLAG